MRLICLVLLLMLVCMAGCATQDSLNLVRTDVDIIKTRLFSVEKDVTGLREESREGLGSIEKEFKSEVLSVRKLSADLQAALDSTKNDMQVLNGRLDDSGSSVKKTSEDVSRYREDADKRILLLEDRLLKVQTVLDEMNKKMAALEKQREETPKQPVTPPTPDGSYMKALELFKAGDMSSSRAGFTSFLEQFPQHDLAPNAYYWIGESYANEKNYEPAILAYQEVISRFPTKDKVPAAMLKQAMAFKAIKDTKSAKYVLKKVVEGYPKSEEAKKAAELLKEMK